MRWLVQILVWCAIIAHAFLWLAIIAITVLLVIIWAVVVVIFIAFNSNFKVAVWVAVPIWIAVHAAH